MTCTARDGRLVPPAGYRPTFRAFEKKLFGVFEQTGEELSRERGINELHTWYSSPYVILEIEMDGAQRKEIS